jgi:hypothetical protein
MMRGEFSSFAAPQPNSYRAGMRTSSEEFRMHRVSLSIAAVWMALSFGTALASDRSVSLTQDPLVMRLNKDEFRIAFGINGEHCGDNGCSGLIRYRVDWKTADGTTRSETKHVSYTVSPRARRTIAVDRQYFDTAEGQHETHIVKVSIDTITCRDGTLDGAQALQRL